MGILGKRRVNVCTSCQMGPCVEDKPKCLPNDSGSDVRSAAKTDWYGQSGDRVSMEEAAETEFTLKEILDNDVDAENKFGSAPRERQAPCRRRKGSVHS